MIFSKIKADDCVVVISVFSLFFIFSSIYLIFPVLLPLLNKYQYLSGWVQAIGSILALVVAIAVPYLVKYFDDNKKYQIAEFELNSTLENLEQLRIDVECVQRILNFDISVTAKAERICNYSIKNIANYPDKSFYLNLLQLNFKNSILMFNNLKIYRAELMDLTDLLDKFFPDRVIKHRFPQNHTWSIGQKKKFELLADENINFLSSDVTRQVLKDIDSIYKFLKINISEI